MTTNHHTPIATGAAANAATFNAPFSSLDSAITNMLAGTQAFTKLLLASATELTIAAGAITVTQGYHTVDTEGDAASDNLDTIAGGVVGFIALRAANTARTVVLRHGVGNIYTPQGTNFSLDSTELVALLWWDGTNALLVGDGGAAASGIAGIDVQENGVSVVAEADTTNYPDGNVEDDGANDVSIYWDMRGVCEGRLTLTTGVPVTTANVTGATNVYFAPYAGSRIALYDGTRWVLRRFTELTLAVPATTNTTYDVFCYDNAGTPTLEATAWTNNTTRATALTTQDGVLVRTGATTRRYLGSFQTTGVSGQTEASTSNCLVWNYYHRHPRNLQVVETTNSWAYTTSTWRAANNSTANRVNVLIGWAEDTITAEVSGYASSASGSYCAVGIGIDATDTNSSTVGGGYVDGTGAILSAKYRGYLAVGFHYIQWIEIGGGANATTFTGDNGLSYFSAGLMAEVWA